MKKHQAGVTLIELLAVVAVMAILAAVAGPSFRTLVQQSRLKGAASDLYADLQYARYEAIQRNRCVAVTFDTTTGSYTIATLAGGSGTGCPSGTATTLKTITPEGVTMSLSGDVGTASPKAITFEPRQGTVLLTGNIRFTGGSYSAENQVNLLGRVRLCSPSGSVTGYPSC